ncbi:hypothetical protein BI347_22185 [Chromobacterium sphagni]|uniref:Uncharacterized protein n=1 Tax=Chromobacterium sphagni TaxID=1903179 RepID=A0A1S1WTH8_9NEIS|nr:hypothetical protein BI347_22185 [Chromobacterium sphagni]
MAGAGWPWLPGIAMNMAILRRLFCLAVSRYAWCVWQSAKRRKLSPSGYELRCLVAACQENIIMPGFLICGLCAMSSVK